MTQYDDDDALENGVLRDGARYRVHMCDGQSPSITDGTDDPLQRVRSRRWECANQADVSRTTSSISLP
jgi:hypothetical protein